MRFITDGQDRCELSGKVLAERADGGRTARKMEAGTARNTKNTKNSLTKNSPGGRTSRHQNMSLPGSISEGTFPELTTFECLIALWDQFRHRVSRKGRRRFFRGCPQQIKKTRIACQEISNCWYHLCELLVVPFGRDRSRQIPPGIRKPPRTRFEFLVGAVGRDRFRQNRIQKGSCCTLNSR